MTAASADFVGYTKSGNSRRVVGPGASAEGDDAPRLLSQLVAGVATVVNDVFIGGEDAIG
jgi:hypothetical protein